MGGNVDKFEMKISPYLPPPRAQTSPDTRPFPGSSFLTQISVSRVQGTHDDGQAGSEWREYEFKVKPGSVKRRPRFISPYHYRLDWLMWFLPFSDSRRCVSPRRYTCGKPPFRVSRILKLTMVLGRAHSEESVPKCAHA